MQSNVEHFAGDIEAAIKFSPPIPGTNGQFFERLMSEDPTVVDEINEDLKKQRRAPWLELPLIAVSGQRERANAYAASMDAQPGGATALQEAVDNCDCGAPFDIDVTPNYAATLERSGLPWPMNESLYWPMKDW